MIDKLPEYFFQLCIVNVATPANGKYVHAYILTKFVEIGVGQIKG